MITRPKDPYSKTLINKIKKHMEKEYPNEGCGVIVGKTFHPCENTAEDPSKEFLIKKEVMAKFIIMGKKISVVHSHVNCEAIPSKSDQLNQIAINCVWGIFPVQHGLCMEPVWWGDDLEVEEYTQRLFIWGVWHCYSLYRDWWRKERGVIIPNFAVDNEFIRDGESVFIDNCEKAGLTNIGKPDISDLQVGDMLVANIKSDFPNHCGVYVGNDIFMHHPEDGLSRRDTVLRYWKHITVVFRNEKFT